MVKNNSTKNRYELAVGEHLAIADYRLEGNNLVITHVETPPQLQGQGIAGKVMAGVVEDAKAHGLTIVPVCSYAVAYMKRHA